MVNMVRIGPTTAEDDPQIEAAKQQVALAIANMRQGGSPAGVPLAQGAGAVQAKYGIGNALLDVANKLAQGYAVGQANSRYGALKAQQDAALTRANEGKLDSLAPMIQGGQKPTPITLDSLSSPQAPSFQAPDLSQGRQPTQLSPVPPQPADPAVTMNAQTAVPDQANPARAMIASVLAGQDQRSVGNALSGLQLRNAFPDPAVVESAAMRKAMYLQGETDKGIARQQHSDEFATTDARLKQAQADSVDLTKAQIAAKAAEETRGVVVAGVDPITHQSTSNLINPKTGEIIKANVGTPASATAGSARMKIFNDRVFTNAKEATASMHNIANSPMTADTGIFGIGSHQVALQSAPLRALKNKMTSQDVQTYNSKLMGLGRNLGVVESGGLQVSDTFLQSFEQAKAMPGDTNLTKLHKLAEVRQIVDQAMDVKLSNPDVPDEQKKMLRTMLDDLHKSVPFTHDQVDALETSDKPDAKVSDFIAKSGLSGNSFASEAEAEAAAKAGTIKAGDKVVVGGVKGTWH